MKNKLIDLIDFEKVNILLEGFNKLTGFVTAILDLDGNILSNSGWRQICTEFHRVHPATAKKCTISDTELAGKMAEGEKYHFYKCLNGLVDVAVPIVIKDEHIGNLFSGQFFFEKPDRKFFENQAKKYNFDNTEYLNALDKVPVVSEEKVKVTMEFLLDMTRLISEMTLQKLEQKKLNEKLKSSEERWQFAIEGNGDGLWDWNVETNEIYFSKQWKEMLGFRENEIENKFDEWDKRVHPDDKAKAYQDVQNHLDGKTDEYNNEHRMLCKDGTYKWIHARGKIITRTIDDKPLRCIGTHTNITENKQAQEALQKSEKDLKRTQQITKIGSWHLDLKTNQIRWTEELYEMYGFDPALPPPILDESFNLFTKESWDLLSSSIAKTAETGTPYEIELKTIRKDGGNGWMWAQGEAIKDENGEIIALMGAAQDITERKQAEELVLKNKNRLDYALNIIETGAWELDLIKRDAWRSFDHDKIFGYSTPLAEWTYDMFLEHVIPEDRERVDEKFQKAIATKTDWNFECRINRKDGAVRWIFGCGNHELNKDNEATKMFGIVQDITERKLNEDKLRDSEEKYKALYENAPLSYQSLNEDGIFKDVNPRWLETLGYERNEVIGKKYADFLHPDWAAHFEKNFPAFKKRGYVNDVQFKLRHKKGHYIDISFEGCIGYNTDGSFRQTYCVFQDITERKQAEEKLKISHNRYRLAQEIGHIGSWEYSIQNALFWASDEGKRLFNLNPEQKTFTLEEVESKIPNKEKTNKALMDLIEREIPYNLEYEVFNKETGESRTIYSIAQLERDEKGAPSKVSGVILDITDRKIAEEKLKVSEEKFRSLYNNSPDMYVSVSPHDATILLCNDTLLEKTAYSKEEVIGKPIFNMYHPDCMDDVKKVFKQFTDTGEIKNRELILKRKDGSKIEVSLNVDAIKDETGKILYSMSSWRDITESKIAEEALLKSNKRFEKITALTPIPIIITNANKDIEYFNNKFSEVFGYTLQDVSTLEEWWLLVYPDKDYRQLVQETWEAAILKASEKNEPIETQEWKFVRKDGQARIVEFDMIPLGDISIITLNDVTDRREAEEAIKLSEEKFAKAFKVSPYMVSLSSMDGLVVEVNDKVFETFGYTRDEFIGQNTTELSLWVNLNERSNFVNFLNEDGALYEMDVQFRKKSGEIGDYLLSASIIEVNENKLLLSIIHDTTERKVAENKVIDALEKLTNAEAIAGMGNWSWNPNTNEVLWSDNMCRLYGIDPSEFNPSFDYANRYTHPDDLDYVSKIMECLLTEKKPQPSAEYRILTPDNKIKWVEATSKLLFDEKGEISEVVGTIQDITERKESEKALLQSEEKFKISFQSNPVPQSILTLDGVFIESNLAFVELIGFSREEIIGKTTADLGLLSLEERNKLAAYASASGGSIHNANTKFKIRDGSLRDILYSVESIVLNGVPHRLSMGIDVTEQKQIEKFLIESEEKFRGIYEQSPIAIEIYDKDGKLVDVNQTTLEMFGVDDKKYILGFNLWADPNLSAEKIQSLKNGKAIFLSTDFDFELVKKQNLYPTKRSGIMYMDMYAIPMMEENQITGYLVQIAEITDRKQAEEEINKLTHLLKETGKMAKIGGWELDVISGEATWTEEVALIYDLDPNKPAKVEEGINLYKPESRKVIEEALKNAIEHVKSYDLELEIISAKGNHKWVRTIGQPIQEEGKVIRVYGSFQDITERKQFVKKLQDRNEYIESIMENMPIGFALNSIDDGAVKYMNERFEEIYGWPRDILTNTSIFFEKVFPDPEYRDKMTNQIVSDMQSGDPEKMIWNDLKIITSTGEVRYVHSFNIPLIEQNLMISTVQDSTKRKLAEDEVKSYRLGLEELVKERTKNLDEKNEELERMNKLFVGRELRMVELKEKIKELENR